MDHNIVSDYTDVNENSNIKVFVRARPPAAGDSSGLALFEVQQVDGRDRKLSFNVAAAKAQAAAAAVATAAGAEEDKRRKDASSGLAPGVAGMMSAEAAPALAALAKAQDKASKAAMSGGGVGEHAFQFDGVFWTGSKQADIFDQVCKPQVEHALRGYNACAFAYGQTGSGKTYSMFGEDGGKRGIIPRSIEHLFTKVAARARGKTHDVAVVVSFLEIYCDTIRDLGRAYLLWRDRGGAGDSNGALNRTAPAGGGAGAGSDSLGHKTSDIYAAAALSRSESFRGQQSHPGAGMAPSLSDKDLRGIGYDQMAYQIHEDTEGNVFVKNLQLISVTSLEEAMAVIELGLALRATHETKMNAVSSRSHSVFTVTTVQRDKSTGEAITGKLNLVDLAGSERLKKSGSMDQRLQEALHINKSLTALGKVIMALDPSVNQAHVPYRDSKLTRLLQNSLGGNSFTSLIATIHPVRAFAEECLSTLQFANRCRAVMNRPRVNYVQQGDSGGAAKDRRLKQMGDELQALKQQLAAAKHGSGPGGSGGGGSGGGGGGVAAAQAIVDALRELGMDAEVITEGEHAGMVRLADGRIVGGSALARGGGGGAKSSVSALLGGDDLPANVRLAVQNLEADRKQTRRKLDAKKAQLQAVMADLKAAQAESASAHAFTRKTEDEMKALLAAERAAASERKRADKRSGEAQLADIVKNNQLLLEEADARNQALQEAGVAAPDGYKGLKAEKAKRLAAEKERRAVKWGHEAELRAVKHQYEFWLEQYSAQQVKFVDQFNVYRERKRTTLTTYEGEMRDMWSALVMHGSVLRKLLGGEYPVHNAGGTTTPLVPPASLPPDLTSRATALPSTRAVLAKAVPGDAVGAAGAAAAGASGEPAVGSLRPRSGSRSRPGSAAARRPSTAPRSRSRAASASAADTFGLASARGRLEASGADLGATGASWYGSGGAPVAAHADAALGEPLHARALAASADVDAMEPGEVRRALAEMQLYVHEQLNGEVQRQVRAELSAHETVDYIKGLESDKARAREALRTQTRKFNSLRIAYESIRRKTGVAK